MKTDWSGCYCRTEWNYWILLMTVSLVLEPPPKIVREIPSLLPLTPVKCELGHFSGPPESTWSSPLCSSRVHCHSSYNFMILVFGHLANWKLCFLGNFIFNNSWFQSHVTKNIFNFSLWASRQLKALFPRKIVQPSLRHCLLFLASSNFPEISPSPAQLTSTVK